MGPQQWMGAISMRVQTDAKNHNNPYAIYMTPAHWLHQSKKLSVCKKQGFLTLKCCFWTKYIHIL